MADATISLSVTESTTQVSALIVTAETSDGKDYALSYTIGETNGTVQTSAGKASLTLQPDESVGMFSVLFTGTGLTEASIMLNQSSASPAIDVKYVTNADGSLWVVPQDPIYMKTYFQRQLSNDTYDLISELTYAVHMLYDWMIIKDSGATPTANQQATIDDIKANYAPLLSLTLEKAMQATEWRYTKALKPTTQLMNQVQADYLQKKLKAYGSI
ncbi:hypothetical protein PP175_21295 [Aneurinibacillus sp. Ricciae_BoGa-3]|uniref:hypothetical protein n=1 Tax=Aneurinibacillus sp. Ricciae_BoGa-3 TaxID=3022697 RepID=UPI00233FD404|nr:hypothetical protein [Aneurinibacillus sp. Ricciae_BoGa-3]WCK53827.1 hypothetical protein PP175_21295 [Aneurinibacillus sp. Ricciae_BoGa-3]